MRLPKLSPGYAALKKTMIINMTGKKENVSRGDKICLMPTHLIEQTLRKPLERLVASLGVGSFTVRRIIQSPTKSICFEFFDRDETLHTINRGYFACAESIFQVQGDENE